MRINTNISSLQAQRFLSNTTKALSRALERLSSGKRITRAGDDAAGLAISEGLQSQVRGLRQVARNINDAFGFLNTADGAIATQTELVQRMRELAIQSANGTIAANHREYLDEEFQKLVEEFNRITEEAEFNGNKLLDGSLSGLSLQVGTQSGDSIGIQIERISLDRSVDTSGAIYEGDGTFSENATYSMLGDISSGVGFGQLADLNNDGNLDLIEADAGTNMLHLRYGAGDGTFGAVSSLATGTQLIRFGGPAIGDLNNDGLQDLLQYNFWSDNISVYVQNASGGFTAAATVGVGVNPDETPNLADMNNDGNLDIVIANATSNSVSVALGNGDGSFTNSATLAAGNMGGYGRTFVEDFNGDGDLDIIASNYNSNNLSVFLGDGSGGFSQGATVTPTSGLAPVGATIDDFNNDGKMDVLTPGWGGTTVSVLLGVGDGTFIETTAVNSWFQHNAIGTSDFNNDGNQDFYTVSGGDGATRVFLGNGSGGFAAASVVSTGDAGTPQDIDGDGNIDFVGRNGVLLGNGDGTFQLPTTLTTSGISFTGALVGDLNGDGVLDLVATGQNGSNVSHVSVFLQGTTSESTTSTGEAALNIRTRENAENILNGLDITLTNLLASRAGIGASQNRLESALSNALVMQENVASARSQILDADIAEETAELTRAQILQQAGVSVLGQANSSLQMVLTLLRP